MVGVFVQNCAVISAKMVEIHFQIHYKFVTGAAGEHFPPQRPNAYALAVCKGISLATQIPRPPNLERPAHAENSGLFRGFSQEADRCKGILFTRKKRAEKSPRWSFPPEAVDKCGKVGMDAGFPGKIPLLQHQIDHKPRAQREGHHIAQI